MRAICLALALCCLAACGGGESDSAIQAGQTEPHKEVVIAGPEKTPEEKMAEIRANMEPHLLFFDDEMLSNVFNLEAGCKNVTKNISISLREVTSGPQVCTVNWIDAPRVDLPGMRVHLLMCSGTGYLSPNTEVTVTKEDGAFSIQLHSSEEWRALYMCEKT